ncbi:MAG: FAD-dependent oxidoreductase [Bacteroidetes bacterium]|nr:FAD-dependent oxidoreductase [Bacteroidota bacterium]
MLDYLIVGQGLAGSLLAWNLEKLGAAYHLLDPGLEGSASVTAAGIVNPVTGRRFVKSWHFDKLGPVARETYSELENQFQQKFYFPRNIIRTLFNRKDSENWSLRTADPIYQPYMQENANIREFEKATIPAFDYGETLQAAQTDLPGLVRRFREYFLEKECLTVSRFQPSQLEIADDHVAFAQLKAKNIVFCEGYKGAENPWFSYLPFGGTKGEVLLIRIPDANFEKIFKHRVFIVPLKDDLYWVGSKYDWNFDDTKPSPEGKKYLQERLSEILEVPCEIVEHKAAVRPTVKDRRPFLGRHPQEKRLAVFNGLGTKGASLGPYFAKELADHLVLNKPLTPDVNIKRYESQG